MNHNPWGLAGKSCLLGTHSSCQQATHLPHLSQWVTAGPTDLARCVLSVQLGEACQQSILSVHCRHLPLASQQGTPRAKGKSLHRLAHRKHLLKITWKKMSLPTLERWVHPFMTQAHTLGTKVPPFWLLRSLMWGHLPGRAPRTLEQSGWPPGMLSINNSRVEMGGAKVRDFLKTKSDSESLYFLL